MEQTARDVLCTSDLDKEYFTMFIGNGVDLPLDMTFPPMTFADGNASLSDEVPLLAAAPSKRKRQEDVKKESEDDSEYEPEAEAKPRRRTTEPTLKPKAKAKGKKRKAGASKDAGVSADLLQKEKEGSLTAKEQATLKKQRRLAKNRTAAAQFRARQKDYIGSLEKQVEQLGTERTQQTHEISALQRENAVLRESLSHLRQWVSSAVTFAVPQNPSSVEFLRQLQKV